MHLHPRTSAYTPIQPLLTRRVTYIGLVAHARAVPPPPAGVQPRMAPGPTAQAQGGGGGEDLRRRVQGGHADDEYEFSSYEGVFIYASSL